MIQLKKFFNFGRRESQKNWTMFESSKEEVSKLLENKPKTEIYENTIVILDYPFQPSSIYQNNTIKAENIVDIDFESYPPTIHIKDELIFTGHDSKEKLKFFAKTNNVKEVKREDIWSWILEPFLDTEVTEEQNIYVSKKLSEYGFDKEFVRDLRKEVEIQMLKYNFDTMLWEWVNLNAMDVLKAMRTKYDEENYKLFYQKVMKIALTEKVSKEQWCSD